MLTAERMDAILNSSGDNFDGDYNSLYSAIFLEIYLACDPAQQHKMLIVMLRELFLIDKDNRDTNYAYSEMVCELKNLLGNFSELQLNNAFSEIYNHIDYNKIIQIWYKNKDSFILMIEALVVFLNNANLHLLINFDTKLNKAAKDNITDASTRFFHIIGASIFNKDNDVHVSLHPQYKIALLKHTKQQLPDSFPAMRLLSREEQQLALQHMMANDLYNEKLPVKFESEVLRALNVLQACLYLLEHNKFEVVTHWLDIAPFLFDANIAGRLLIALKSSDPIINPIELTELKISLVFFVRNQTVYDKPSSASILEWIKNAKSSPYFAEKLKLLPTYRFLIPEDMEIAADVILERKENFISVIHAWLAAKQLKERNLYNVFCEEMYRKDITTNSIRKLLSLWPLIPGDYSQSTFSSMLAMYIFGPIDGKHSPNDLLFRSFIYHLREQITASQLDNIFFFANKYLEEQKNSLLNNCTRKLKYSIDLASMFALKIGPELCTIWAKKIISGSELEKMDDFVRIFRNFFTHATEEFQEDFMRQNMQKLLTYFAVNTKFNLEISNLICAFFKQHPARCKAYAETLYQPLLDILLQMGPMGPGSQPKVPTDYLYEVAPELMQQIYWYLPEQQRISIPIHSISRSQKYSVASLDDYAQKQMIYKIFAALKANLPRSKLVFS